MESTEKSSKHELRRRVRELRETFGESQEAFARRLKSSVRTVARYETAAPPSGRSLAQLAKLARSEGRVELWAFFEAALAEELYGAEEPDASTVPDPFEAATIRSQQKQRREHTLFLYLFCIAQIVGDPKWAELRASLKNVLMTLLEEDAVAENVLANAAARYIMENEPSYRNNPLLAELGESLGQIVAPVLTEMDRDAAKFAHERSDQADKDRETSPGEQ